MDILFIHPLLMFSCCLLTVVFCSGELSARLDSWPSQARGSVVGVRVAAGTHPTYVLTLPPGWKHKARRNGAGAAGVGRWCRALGSPMGRGRRCGGRGADPSAGMDGSVH